MHLAKAVHLNIFLVLLTDSIIPLIPFESKNRVKTLSIEILMSDVERTRSIYYSRQILDLKQLAD